MNIWKTAAKLGRGGDTEIRIVDRKPSHVNPYEAYLIDNYKEAGEAEVKRIGSGTTNPDTGLKEYISFGITAPDLLSGIGNLAGGATSAVGNVASTATKSGLFGGMGALGVIGLGVQGLSMLSGGFSALQQKKQAKKARKGIEANFADQIRKLTEAKDRQFEKIDTQYGMQTEQVSTGTETALGGLTKAATDVQIGQGFETSEESTVDTSTMLAEHRSAIDNLVASREGGRKESLEGMQTGMEQVEDQRAKMLADLPDYGSDLEAFASGMVG